MLRSLLDPTVPISALSHLPLDSPVLVLRQVSDVMRASAIKKLYFIAPSLDDSSSTVLDEVSRETREPDERDFVIRFLLRELLLYKADAEVLAKANRTQSIDKFLRESSVEHLESYIRFFEVFQEGRNDTFHLLRDAVCDYLLDSQAPSTTKILGAEVTTEENLRRMTAKVWDVLWVSFNDIVQWWNLEYFDIQFEDLVLVKTLIACHRYGFGDSDDGDDASNWYSPDEDVSQECKLAVLQGFIAVIKGISEPPRPANEIENGIVKERQTRCYLVGRMSKDDTWARC